MKEDINLNPDTIVNDFLLNGVNDSAHEIYKMFKSFVDVGFTRGEALQIILRIMSHVLSSN